MLLFLRRSCSCNREKEEVGVEEVNCRPAIAKEINTSLEFDRQFVQSPSMFHHYFSEVSGKRDMLAWLA